MRKGKEGGWEGGNDGMQLIGEKEGRHEGGNAGWREGGRKEGIQLDGKGMGGKE